ncbi:hypothetical protein ACSSS7_003742 [Eimeria intestinalis]
MAPRGIICHMCGGEFFKQSLPIHQKACAAKQRHILLQCQFCNKELPKLELEEHLARCSKAPKRKAAAQQSSEHGAEGGGVSTVFDASGRLQCAVCGRWFNADRVAKHQGICERTSQKKRAVFDSFRQRKFDALIQRAAPVSVPATSDSSGGGGSSRVAAARSYYCFERPGASATKSAKSGSSPISVRGERGSMIGGGARGGTAAGGRHPASRQATGGPAQRLAGTTHASSASAAFPATRSRALRQSPLADQRSPVASSKPSSLTSRGRGRQAPFSNLGRRDRRQDFTSGYAGRGGAALGSNNSAVRVAGGGEILTSNLSSLDNPLAYPTYPT